MVTVLLSDVGLAVLSGLSFTFVTVLISGVITSFDDDCMPVVAWVIGVVVYAITIVVLCGSGK